MIATVRTWTRSLNGDRAISSVPSLPSLRTPVRPPPPIPDVTLGSRYSPAGRSTRRGSGRRWRTARTALRARLLQIPSTHTAAHRGQQAENAVDTVAREERESHRAQRHAVHERRALDREHGDGEAEDGAEEQANTVSNAEQRAQRAPVQVRADEADDEDECAERAVQHRQEVGHHRGVRDVGDVALALERAERGLDDGTEGRTRLADASARGGVAREGRARGRGGS